MTSSKKSKKKQSREVRTNTHKLLYAFHDNDLCTVRFLGETLDINMIVDDDDCTLLMHAAGEGRFAMITLLLELNANVNDVNKRGMTALMVACEENNLQCVEALLNGGADANMVPNSGYPAALRCALYGSLECLTFLHRHGIDVRVIVDGYNALKVACAEGHVKCAAYLIANGALDDDSCPIDNLDYLMVSAKYGRSKCIELLVQAKVDPNRRSIYGFTPLFSACDSGNVASVCCLIQANVDVNICGDNGLSPLMVCCNSGHCVDLLLRTKANPNVVVHGWCALSYAAQAGHSDIVRTLVNAGATLVDGKPSGSYVFPLCKASEKGHYDCVKTLLELCPTGFCPELLHIAVRAAVHNQHFKCVRELVRAKADLVCQDDNKPLLCISAQLRDIDTTVELVKGGCSVDTFFFARSTNGSDKRATHSILTYACSECRPEFVKFLLENAADPNISAKISFESETRTFTPLMISTLRGNQECFHLLIDNETVDVNIQSDSRDNGERSIVTPLMNACKNGNESFASMLVRRNADVNAVTQDGTTALMLCCLSGSIPCVSLLLKSGAFVKEMNGDGFTAVGCAVLQNNNMVLRTLLRGNANVDEICSCDATPLTIAIRRSRIDCLRTLIEHNADVNHAHLRTAFLMRNVTCLQMLLDANASLSSVEHFIEPFTNDEGQRLLHTTFAGKKDDEYKCICALVEAYQKRSVLTRSRWKFAIDRTISLIRCDKQLTLKNKEDAARQKQVRQMANAKKMQGESSVKIITASHTMTYNVPDVPSVSQVSKMQGKKYEALERVADNERLKREKEELRIKQQLEMRVNRRIAREIAQGD